MNLELATQAILEAQHTLTPRSTSLSSHSTVNFWPHAAHVVCSPLDPGAWFEYPEPPVVARPMPVQPEDIFSVCTGLWYVQSRRDTYSGYEVVRVPVQMPKDLSPHAFPVMLWHCSCPDFSTRRVHTEQPYCKHIFAVYSKTVRENTNSWVLYYDAYDALINLVLELNTIHTDPREVVRRLRPLHTLVELGRHPSPLSAFVVTKTGHPSETAKTLLALYDREYNHVP